MLSTNRENVYQNVRFSYYNLHNFVLIKHCKKLKNYSMLIVLWIFKYFKVSDQTAAMFGQCCFDIGDIKCTMGTGTFVDVNTGSTPHASIAGLYLLWITSSTSFCFCFR